jgi:FkbM family methyltransferase
LKKLIKKIFKKAGYDIVPAGKPSPVVLKHNPDSMVIALTRNNKLIKKPSSVIDLGAAQGNWTKSVLQIWPDANYLLFEPLAEREPDLQKLKNEKANVDFVMAAAGAAPASIRFNVTDDLDGSGFYSAAEGGRYTTRNVRVTTVDSEIKNKKLKGPFILKFDTHGFEIPILAGAKNVLPETELIVMECYGFILSPECKLFPEMCMQLDQLGFRLSDIIKIERRPGDSVFWQCDAIFLRKENPVYQNNNYR